MSKKGKGNTVKLPVIGQVPVNQLKIVSAILIVAILYYFRGILVAATVNGSPVSRISVIKELEKRQGRSVLDSLITEVLIEQEAKKQSINVSQAELDAEVATIEASLQEQGQGLDEVLKLQGITKKEFVKQIKLQKLVEKLLSDSISVTEEEIDQYLEDNEGLFSEDADVDETRETVRQQLNQQKLSEGFQEWITEARESAQINYFTNY